MKIVIDAGHGGHDSGATYRGMKEKDITLEIAKKILWVCGNNTFFLTRSTDVYLTLRERCDFANNMGADYFLSIHCNADPDSDEPGMPEARGEELWIYEGSEKGMDYGKKLKKYIDLIMPDEPFRGVKESKHGQLHVLTHTKMPAGLVEVGFIDNSQTWRHFQDKSVITEIACCLTLGLLRI
jgi:N-acetylmuramoyl-L-alanine amidase